MCPSCRWASLPLEVRGAMARSHSATRRARKVAAEIAGPVPAAIYTAVLTSGPCVYCGARAATVDHIRPLARGGHEAEYNLVPACGPCNYSKHDRLLADWRPDRVAHAVAVSPLVAAEYERQLAA
jgi:5-methylcytosine-specific restriction endonuclease McrA